MDSDRQEPADPKTGQVHPQAEQERFSPLDLAGWEKI